MSGYELTYTPRYELTWVRLDQTPTGSDVQRLNSEVSGAKTDVRLSLTLSTVHSFITLISAHREYIGDTTRYVLFSSDAA